MVDVSDRFIQIASIVTDKIAQLLYAPVLVTDGKGMVITSSEPYQVGLALDWKRGEKALENFLRVPLQYEAGIGEVIVGEPFNQEVISPRLAQILVELVVNQTTANQDQRPSQHELKNQLIYDLLHSRVRDETVVLTRARQLGMDLTPPRAVILINAVDYILKNSSNFQYELTELEQQRRTQVVISSIVNFFHLPSDTICADLGQGNVCVLKASDTKNLNPWADGDDIAKSSGSSWSNLVALKRAADALLLRLRNDTGAEIDIGIGRYHPGVQGLARSYEDARAALSLGSRFRGHNRVHCLGELGVAAFVGVSDENTKVDLAKHLLGPLDHEPELLTTLDVFFAENCCPSSTAKRLSIHRNTLSYRLDKIFSLTGLEPRRFDDAVQMRLCLLLRSLHSP
ncbi:PucR family transcriptional regulator [Pantanalinema sp. GBBB05]|uniref:PucR family transcriptional regulator n=1 Tax=Pantanalinema sp. GBBB05 TaxID=2604139 RepID=UPI001D6B68B1|nr:CdaR family transcriptional regulator [Pantanalinema sp. GBBB05]